MKELEGKVAIITGAARGQGAAEARLFAANGARVVLTDLDKDGAAVAEEIGEAALFVQHDVSSASDWAEVVRQTVDRFGTVDILINNAGIYKPKPILETDEDNFDLHYRVNQRGPFLGMKAVIDVMTKAGRGSIVNISSTAGMMNFPGAFAYSMTKWASRGMSKVAAFELAPLGIRINSVHPGVIDTPMLDENPPGMLDLFKAFIPMQRSGTPAEVAEMVMFLASDRASYITGAEVSIAGGVC